MSIASTGALPTRAFAAPGTPMLPGEQTCRYELPSHMVWWAQEIWAWERLCLGEIANLSQFNSGAGTNCDPRKADQWPDSRNLRSLFFETLLDHEPYRTVLRRNGLRVACANVAEALNLSHLAIEHALWIQSTRFRGLVNLVDFKSSSLINLYDMVADRQVVADRLRVAGDLRLNKSELKNFRLTEAMIGGDLDASGATFANTLFAQRLTVGGNLYLRNNARFLESGKLGSVVLRGAKISGHLWASGSVFEGLFNADRLQIGGNLYLHEGTTFQDIHLRDARVDGHVSASGSFFNGSFRGDRLHVRGDLILSGGAKLKEVRLLDARVGGLVNTAGSIFAGRFNAERLSVGGNLFLRDGAEFGDVSLKSAEIGGHLFFRGSRFDGNVDLTGARIAGELHLTSPRLGSDSGYPPPLWAPDAKLILRNAHVTTINDSASAWPNKLDLVGFTYERLGGLRATEDSVMSARTSEWLRAWLAKQDGLEALYIPQPFEQLARVLRANGRPGKADEILAAARDHERDSPATPLLTRAGLWLQWALIGYGYNNWIAVIWFACLIALGALVCRASPYGRRMAAAQRFWYSFDMALPVIELNKRHEAVKLAGRVLAYFYVHKMIGFVLVSFLVAGLSGLTK